MVALIALVVVLLFAVFLAARTIRIIPQARAGVVERLGRYHRMLEPGLSIVLPFIDRVKPLIDLREQVISFPPSGQMRAERDRRAAILNAEGLKQSQILTAEGEKQSAVLRAERQKQAAILTAEGEAQAIGTVFRAIHEGDPDPKLLSYQYLQMLPRIAQGDANKLWVIPSELTSALARVSTVLGVDGDAPAHPGPRPL